MKNGKFVGQTAKEISQEELDLVINMIKDDLKKFSVKVTDISIKDAYEGFNIKFTVDGLNFASRDRARSLVSPITAITVYFTSQWGYNDGDWDFVSDMPPLDKSSYSFNFSTDGKYRMYRRRTWYKLEGKNHYIYNDDLNDDVLHQEIYSYLCNLVAQKGL